MSSSKYILNTDGTITKKTGTTSKVIEEVEDITRDMISGFNDLESTRTIGGVIKASPPLILPLGGATDKLLLSKLDTAVSVDKEGLLKNDSFGTSEDITYYSQFNTIFPKQGSESSTSKIYAEELEILAGFDLNSIGVFDFTKQSADFVKYTFILDYVLESAAYIAVAETITRSLKEDNNFIGKNVFYDYFYDVLNYPSFNISGKFEPIAYFLIGLNEFVNTDPRFEDLIKQDLVKKMTGLNTSADLDISDPNLFSSQFLVVLLDNLLSLSKLEHNRILLLIRKFQQESFWHKNILYKAKKDSSEEFVDKLFVEFSQYYFKFIVERMHIGRMIWRRKSNIQLKKDRTISGRNRLSEERNLNSTGNNIKFSRPGENYVLYNWSPKIARHSGNNTFTLASLPNLLKTNSYIKKEVLRKKKLQQNFDDSDKNEQRRLSPKLVKEIEEHLGNEYMPFYFHDLRTNEILAFHAFIDTISDSFSPNYNPSSGYGRIDDVQHYTKTTRTINTTFSLVSYNQDDHDLMWYQINKIVMMVYPQWSKGIKKNDKEVYPFTQMPTASPLIRLRIGDVITSNYSKENLARLHSAKRQKQRKSKNRFQTKTVVIDSKVLSYQKYHKHKLGKSFRDNQFSLKDALALFNPTSTNLSQLGLSSNINTYLDNFSFDVKRGDEVIIHDQTSVNGRNYLIASLRNSNAETFYIPEDFVSGLDNKTNYKNNAGKSIVDAKRNGKINNPFTAAYESSRGEGLAGFITNLDINYNESTWQTEIKGSRAPMMVKITISFAPVHDIPPGLDHLGEMRAPIYNVGSINRKMFRTPYDDLEPNFTGKKKSSTATANNNPAIDLNEVFNTPDQTDAEYSEWFKKTYGN